MTSFAGSIGIIGIAAILALANGTNAYIAQTEEETLGAYPLTIQKSGMDMSSALSAQVEAASSEKPSDGKVGVSKLRTLADNIRDAKTNDLASLKAFLDGNGGNVNSLVNAIEYDYDVTPQIFQADTSKDNIQVSPDQAMNRMETGMRGSPMSSMMATNAFYQMPQESSLYTSSYDVLAGHWPTSASEVVLVIDEDGNMSNLMEYVLGLKDHKEFDELMRQYYSGTIGEKNSATPTPSPSASDAPAASYDYDKILGITYKRSNAAAKYTWDENYKVWSDHSSDKEFMKKLIDQGQELRISAIVKPNSSHGGALRQGLAYTPELTRQIIREAEDSQIVKDQRANPKTDVFTGKTFQELADSSKDRSSGFDMSSLFTVDQNKLSAAFSIDPSAMQMDLSGLDFSGMDLSSLDFSNLDLSGMDLSNIDLSKLVPADGSAVQIDPSKLNLGELSKSVPQLQNVDFPAIIRKTLADGAVKDTAGTYLSSQASQILQGFQDYAQNQIAAGGSTDFSTLLSALGHSTDQYRRLF